MKKAFVFSFLFCSVQFVSGQNIERKILIEKGVFYYTTIDEQFQIATLHTGKFSEGLKTAKHLALPAGRNYDDPIVPFAWDLEGKDVYAINFLVHPLNDRNEALKKIEISSLQEWVAALTPSDVIMKSVDASMLTYNDPYAFIIKRSNTLSNFFYDGIALDEKNYCMAICNNAELSIWNYNGTEWKHGVIQHFPVDGYFSLFEFKKQPYLVLSDGSIHKISGDTVEQTSATSTGTALSNGIIIVNKDDGTIKFLKNDKLDQTTPLNELIKKKATIIL